MSNLKKEVESFSHASRKDFSSTIKDNYAFAQVDPKVIEDCLARGMAELSSRHRQSIEYQVILCLSPSSFVNFQMATLPAIGDEIEVFHQGGREQVYRVIKMRHSAYVSKAVLESNSHSSATIWVELINNPARIGRIS